MKSGTISSNLNVIVKSSKDTANLILEC